MQDERWKFLCEEASTEQDPERLAELVKEINDLIQKKQARLSRIEAETAAADANKNAPAGESLARS
jgi:hypothetical protein